MSNLFILIISYGLLFLAFVRALQGNAVTADVQNLLLLSGAVSNAILLSEAIAILSKDAGRVRRDRVVALVVCAEWLFVAMVIAVDLRKLVPEEWLIATATVAGFVALGAIALARNTRLLIAFLIPIIAIFVETVLPHSLVWFSERGERIARDVAATISVEPHFIAVRYRAWLHLLVIPAVYLIADFCTQRRNSVARDSLGLDFAVFAVGFAAAAAGLAVGLSSERVDTALKIATAAQYRETQYFEEGAAAVVLILGNHAFLVYHQRGFQYGLRVLRRGLADLAHSLTRSAPISALPHPWSDWAARLWTDAAHRWAERSQGERFYREECVDVLLAGVIAGVRGGCIRLVDIGCSDARNVVALVKRLRGLNVDAEELVCIDRIERLLDEAKRSCKGESFQWHTHKVDLSTLEGAARLRSVIPVRNHPTVYLLQYVLQEMPTIVPLLESVVNVMDERDRAIIVVPDDAFVDGLFDFASIERRPPDSAPDGNNPDWEWAGFYPICDSQGYYFLPHFQRSLTKMKDIVRSAGLELQSEGHIVVDDTEAAKESFRGLPYKDLMMGGSTAAVLVLRKDRPARRRPVSSGRLRSRFLALASTCLLMNLGSGALVWAIKLPFYLDSIGTVLATALGGVWLGMTVGILGVLLETVYAPTSWTYAGTSIAIVLFVRVALRWGYLQSVWTTAAFGVLLGVVAALASAPVTAIVWEGVSLAGADAATAFFLATGKTLLRSVFFGGLATDPVDKVLTSLVALAIYRRLPRKWTLKEGFADA